MRDVRNDPRTNPLLKGYLPNGPPIWPKVLLTVHMGRQVYAGIADRPIPAHTKVLTADFIGKYIGNLREEEIGAFSPIDRRLLRTKRAILGEVEAKSVKRY